MKMNPTTSTSPAPALTPAAPAPLLDQTTARALFAVWSGDPALVIDSPPGAGKTRLITQLAHQLSTRARLTVAVAAQTRAQATDVANRIHATGTPTVYLTGKDEKRPSGLHHDIPVRHASTATPGERVLVATTARWHWLPPFTAMRTDVLLIDEAYQATFATLAALGTLADQFVLVGDPGQIDPVVTANTRRWNERHGAPHHPAPTALRAAHGSITTQRLSQTWRLGPETAALIAPLYPDLPFTSARLPRHIASGGRRLPEYQAAPIATTGTPTDPNIALTATTTARSMLGTTLHTDDGDRLITADDIAVIAPHVDQATLAAAALADMPGIYVGTINQAQGLERDVVVAVHPLTGHPDAETFATDLGRLCVALSRHRTHLTVITDTATRTNLTRAHAARPQSAALDVQRRVLDVLLGT